MADSHDACRSRLEKHHRMMGLCGQRPCKGVLVNSHRLAWLLQGETTPTACPNHIFQSLTSHPSPGFYSGALAAASRKAGNSAPARGRGIAKSEEANRRRALVNGCSWDSMSSSRKRSRGLTWRGKLATHGPLANRNANDPPVFCDELCSLCPETRSESICHCCPEPGASTVPQITLLNDYGQLPLEQLPPETKRRNARATTTPKPQSLNRNPKNPEP